MSTSPEFFADVQKEGKPIEEAFADKEVETPSESQPENEPKEETPVEGEDTQPKTEETPADEDENSPFHKRWKSREENLRQELREEFETELEQIRAQIPPKPSEPTNVPDSFKRLYGDDPEAFEAFRSEIRRELSEELSAKDAARAEEYRKQQAESEYWQGWVKEQLDGLESEHGSFDRNAFSEFMLSVKPTDEGNNLDFKTGFDLFQKLNAKEPDSAKSQARKQIADAVTAPSKGDPPKKDYMTSEELRNKSWNSL